MSLFLGYGKSATLYLRGPREGQRVLVSSSPLCAGLVHNVSQAGKQVLMGQAQYATLRPAKLTPIDIGKVR